MQRRTVSFSLSFVDVWNCGSERFSFRVWLWVCMCSPSSSSRSSNSTKSTLFLAPECKQSSSTIIVLFQLIEWHVILQQTSMCGSNSISVCPSAANNLSSAFFSLSQFLSFSEASWDVATKTQVHSAHNQLVCSHRLSSSPRAQLQCVIFNLCDVVCYLEVFPRHTHIGWAIFWADFLHSAFGLASAVRLNEFKWHVTYETHDLRMYGAQGTRHKHIK